MHLSFVPLFALVITIQLPCWSALMQVRNSTLQIRCFAVCLLHFYCFCRNSLPIQVFPSSRFGVARGLLRLLLVFQIQCIFAPFLAASHFLAFKLCADLLLVLTVSMIIDTLVGNWDLVINTLVGNIEVSVCTDWFVQWPHCLFSVCFNLALSNNGCWMSLIRSFALGMPCPSTLLIKSAFHNNAFGFTFCAIVFFLNLCRQLLRRCYLHCF